MRQEFVFWLSMASEMANNSNHEGEKIYTLKNHIP